MGQGGDERAAAMNLKWRQRIGRVPRGWRLAYLAAAAVAGAASGPVEMRVQASLPSLATLLASLPAPPTVPGSSQAPTSDGASGREHAGPPCPPGVSRNGCASASR